MGGPSRSFSAPSYRATRSRAIYCGRCCLSCLRAAPSRPLRKACGCRFLWNASTDLFGGFGAGSTRCEVFCVASVSHRPVCTPIPCGRPSNISKAFFRGVGARSLIFSCVSNARFWGKMSVGQPAARASQRPTYGALCAVGRFSIKATTPNDTAPRPPGSA